MTFTEGRSLDSRSFLTASTHLECCPVRKRLLFFGRVTGFDWPLLLLFARKNPDQASFVQSWMGNEQSRQVLPTWSEVC